MARPLRLDFPGAFHHVMSRSPKGSDVFQNDDQYSAFCDLLGEIVERYHVRIHGFALMRNHYHLLIESVRGNLSKAMSYLNGNYTQIVHWETGSEGSVLRGRFHNKVVTDPNHWRYLLVYLHLNPVKARFVMRINQWRWTSHRFYNLAKVAPEWLTTEDLSAAFGGTNGYRLYLKEVRQGRRGLPDGFDQVLFGGKRSSEMPLFKQDEAPRNLSPDEALGQVVKVSGHKKEEIFREVKGRGGNPVRTVCAWWLVIGAGLSNGEVGQRLEMSHVSVSRALARVRREIVRNPNGDISDWVSLLKQEIE